MITISAHKYFTWAAVGVIFSLAWITNVFPIQCFASSLPSPASQELRFDGPPQNGDVAVTLQQDRLTIVAHNADLKTVLAEISRKTGVSIILRGTAQTPVSAHIENMPVDETIKKLTRGSSHAVIYARGNSNTPSYQPMIVFIYSESKGPERVFDEPDDAASQPTSDNRMPESTETTDAFETLKNKAFEADGEALSQLIGIALDDPNEETRGDAVEALGSIGEERVMDALIQALYDDQAWVIRAASVRAIGNHGGQRALNALEVALNDPVPEVADTARRTLDEMVGGGQDVLPLGDVSAFQEEAAGGTTAPVDSTIAKGGDQQPADE